MAKPILVCKVSVDAYETAEKREILAEQLKSRTGNEYHVIVICMGFSGQPLPSLEILSETNNFVNSDVPGFGDIKVKVTGRDINPFLRT